MTDAAITLSILLVAAVVDKLTDEWSRRARERREEERHG